MNKLLFGVLITLGGLFTSPVFAWPEVDHMNMCGPAVKVVRAYPGSSQGFAQRDQYLEKRGMAYYFRSNCPEVKTPVKKSKTKRSYLSGKLKNGKGVKARKITRQLRGSYDKHADCARVDRLNSYGLPVRVVRRR